MIYFFTLIPLLFAFGTDKIELQIFLLLITLSCILFVWGSKKHKKNKCSKMLFNPNDPDGECYQQHMNALWATKKTHSETEGQTSIELNSVDIVEIKTQALTETLIDGEKIDLSSVDISDIKQEQSTAPIIDPNELISLESVDLNDIKTETNEHIVEGASIDLNDVDINDIKADYLKRDHQEDEEIKTTMGQEEIGLDYLRKVLFNIESAQNETQHTELTEEQHAELINNEQYIEELSVELSNEAHSKEELIPLLKNHMYLARAFHLASKKKNTSSMDISFVASDQKPREETLTISEQRQKAQKHSGTTRQSVFIPLAL